MLNDLSTLAYNNAKSKGFHEKESSLGERLMLIVSELGEALEADRKGKNSDLQTYLDDCTKIDNELNTLLKLETITLEEVEDLTVKLQKASFEANIKDTVEDEIADAFIRLFDLCGKYRIDIDTHVNLKMKYNSLRPRLHGKAY